MHLWNNHSLLLWYFPNKITIARMELSNLSKSVFRCKNGFSIPAVGLGTYKLNGASGVAAMKHAIKTGYKLLDTAFIYKNETEVGQAIAESIKEGVLKSRGKGIFENQIEISILLS